MWDKIKQYIYGAVGLVVAIFAAIFYSRGKKIEVLEGELEDAKGSSNLRKEIENYDKSKQDAEALEEKYRTIRKHFSNGDDDSDSNGPGAA